MERAQVGIFGASGYSGVELTRLLALHPRVSVRFVTSDRWAKESVAGRLDLDGETGELEYISVDAGLALANECDAVLLCTPAEASLDLVGKLRAASAKCRIIDLSGAFRLQNVDTYPAWYNFQHPLPALLKEAVYGMPELFRADVAGASLVANPGCYATAATLSLAPVLGAKLVEPRGLIVNAASGVTGAGRKATEDFSFTELESDFRAYRVFRHQHTPEVQQSLERVAKTPVELTFTTHLLPLKRGILCTTFARLRPGVTKDQVAHAFEAAYANEPLVTLLPSPDAVTLKRAVGTAKCFLAFAIEGDRLLVFASLDNLVKGAAGQAVQNLNGVLGFPETLGLTAARTFHP